MRRKVRQYIQVCDELVADIQVALTNRTGGHPDAAVGEVFRAWYDDRNQDIAWIIDVFMQRFARKAIRVPFGFLMIPRGVWADLPVVRRKGTRLVKHRMLVPFDELPFGGPGQYSWMHIVLEAVIFEEQHQQLLRLIEENKPARAS